MSFLSHNLTEKQRKDQLQVRFISEAARIKARDIDTRGNGTPASARAERNFDHLYGCENLKKETSSPSSFHIFPGVNWGNNLFYSYVIFYYVQFNTQYCRISSSYSFAYREKQKLHLTIFRKLESLLFDNIALIQRSFCG